MKELIAKDLLDIQAVFLRPNEPFTWASGIKSPIYCDNRLTLSYPKVRKDVETGLAKLVQENFPEAENGNSYCGNCSCCISGRYFGITNGICPWWGKKPWS